MSTWVYIIKRIISSIPILFIVSLVSFFLIRLSPIDPLAQLKLNPAISQETIEKEIENLCEKLQDLHTKTLVMITADHGQIDPDGVCLLDYPDITECLTRMPSLEPRTLNLFVKEDSKDKFPELFNQYFAEKFKLYTKEEVIEGKLFGPGEEHAKFRDMLGDYIAIAIDDLSIYFTYEDLQCQKGFHGGMTSDEIRIPFIKIDCKKDMIIKM